MNAAEALKLVRGCARAGRVRFTKHARQRMRERGARDADVIHALSNARRARADGECWRVEGDDTDGDELIAVVAIESGLIVITMF